jgi:Big-like domain-containing protein
MSFSHPHLRRTRRLRRSIAAIVIIGVIAVSLSPSQAKVLAEGTTKALNSVKTLWNSRVTTAPRRLQSGQIEGPSQRAARTQHIKLCPRKISMHVEEGYALVPVPLDQNRQTVHGAQMTWSSNNPSVASVASYGEVEAKSPGHAVITVRIGNKRANVTVEVEAGVRPRISDAEWEQRHQNDCDDPEALGIEFVPANQNEVRASGAAIELSIDARSNLAASRLEGPRDASITSRTKMALRHAVLSAKGSGSMGGFKATRASFVRPRPKPRVPQGGESIEIFPQAFSVQNVVGSPRFSPVETTGAQRS